MQHSYIPHLKSYQERSLVVSNCFAFLQEDIQLTLDAFAAVRKKLEAGIFLEEGKAIADH
ncbi:MAG: hypothetical protein AAFY48_23390 [Bacteroidota bacterium]